MSKCSLCLTEIGDKTICPICGTIVQKESSRDQNNKSLEKLVAEAKKSVVKIHAELSENGYSCGSGWHGSQNLIVTNAHVVVENDKILDNIICEFTSELGLKNNKIPLLPVYVSQVEDIAVLKPVVGQIPYEVPTLKLNPNNTKQGEKIFTIGSPLDYEFTCVDGIVANPDYHQSGSNRVYNTLQTTLILNSGNSGGPVLNMNGEVVGMATFNETRKKQKSGAFINNSDIVSGTFVVHEEVNGYGFCVKSETIMMALQVAKNKL